MTQGALLNTVWPRWEKALRSGECVCVELNCFTIQQKLTQHRQPTILQYTFKNK